MKIVLLGIQGSGKSTQAHRIADHFGFPVISLGGLIRSAIDSNDPFVTEHYPRSSLDAGFLAPDFLVKEVLKRAIDQVTDFVLEGFPRTLDQADFLANHVALEHVVELVLPEEIVRERLLARGRSDDSDQGIRRRIDGYYANIFPIRERFQEEQLLRIIDAKGCIETITDQILSTMKSAEKEQCNREHCSTAEMI